MVHKTDYVANDGVPMVNPANIVNSNVSNKYLVLVSVDKAKDLRKYRLEEGDVVIARRGDLSKCAVINKKQQGFLCGTGSFSLHLIYILPEYFQLVYLSPYVQSILNTECVGATMNNLNQGVLGAVLFPLPPLNEQYKILLELEKYFSFIDLLESKSSNLCETIKQAKSKILDLAIHGKLVPQNPMDEPASELLKRINPKAEITSDNGHYQKLPEGWTILKVGNVAEYINGRAFKPEEWEQTGLPIIRIQNLNDPNAYYNRTKNEYEEKYLIKKGDLLFAWAASLGTYIWKGEDAWLNQHIFKVIPYPFMDKKYLYYAFHAMITEFYRKSHGSGMIHITRKQFEEITLWLPPLTEQYRIVQYLQQVFEKLDSIVENL